MVEGLLNADQHVMPSIHEIGAFQERSARMSAPTTDAANDLIHSILEAMLSFNRWLKCQVSQSICV
jgi:hypothetical protein